MMRRAGALLVLATACSERIQVQEAVPAEDPTGAWAAVVAEATAGGAMDWQRLRQDKAVLERMLAWSAEHGPESDRTRDADEDRRIALLVNAHNAAVAWAVLRRGPAASVDQIRVGPLRRHLFHALQVRVDREWIPLATLGQERIIARFQEGLLHLALYEATRGGPPLRVWPTTGLQDALEAMWRQDLAGDRLLRAEGEGWAASEWLHARSSDLLAWSEAPTLCAWLGAFAPDPRGAWMRVHAEDCVLGSFAEDRGMDGR